MTKVKSEQKVKDLEAKVEELSAKWKRALADYDNLEKRVSGERELASYNVLAHLLLKLLPAVDNLAKANESLKDAGLEMVLKQFQEALRSLGVEEFGKDGDQFDPALHEAIITDETAPKDQIAQVLDSGYKIGNRVIRPAKVSVGSQK
ncbi:MAG: nucleotide exchange factor GrpE [Candidatus Woykebacteria bacterium RIFCSPLOWO2_01_FULL_43_14]|uniref:Protein GrpE n=2 Tax=Candidatus Woykeibacteriota TaxID=1817899 RepID=A0A1G1WVU4_9BACT|nr:MAG: nucleotide exchange factor GrpE [Candidatus Woykebacteria bacterium RIFCSPHIGHO2_02_FULL_43_16b]OGY31824.1 MAG: nucleotide exchange factor GrpE [Candidatus Woykebacteria bacterium RIFCSPLOWO2_01_FULL_43_14]